MRVLFVLAASLVGVLAADVIDNGVSGSPAVECAAEALTVRFNTEHEFEGHVYVKGHFNDKNCRVDATLRNGVNLTVPFTDCDVRRKRSSSPRGLLLSATIIISFHPMFITKIDKSYNVECFYTEAEKSVTQQMDVSNLDVEVITGEIPLPVCRYEVLSETKDGEAVKFATVGQQVYHQWTCDDSGHKGNSRFCATVHSCHVKEESGREVQLLDENGCAVDRYLLNNLIYTNDLTGGQISNVFKFADQPSLFFTCQIRLSIKEGENCVRTSDNCPLPARGKRSVEEKAPGQEVDVFSQSMTVFEIDDPITPSAVKDLGEGASAWTSQSMCVSPLTFGMLIALLASVILISIITVALLCCRPHTVKVNLQG